jgi:hypothetical protein
LFEVLDMFQEQAAIGRPGNGGRCKGNNCNGEGFAAEAHHHARPNIE